MYDPARDTFTSSNELPGDQTELDGQGRRSSQVTQVITEGNNTEDSFTISQPVSENVQPKALSDTNLEAGIDEQRSDAIKSRRMAASSQDPQGSTSPVTRKKRSRSPDSCRTDSLDARPSKSIKHRSTANAGNIEEDGQSRTSKDEQRLYSNSNRARNSSPRRNGSQASDPTKYRPREGRDHHPAQSRRTRSGSPDRRDRRPARSRSPHRRSPENRRHRDAPRRHTPPPKAPEREPTPPPRSPPRQRKRPGAASRIANTEKDAMRQRQIERAKEQAQEAAKAAAVRGVHDVVKQHYNAVPQRGREWRQQSSRIKGLRSFNNWVKSTLIQKFSPSDEFKATDRFSEPPPGLLVLDMGCGKGGDLGKWAKAPQPVALYVGVDPAEVSIDQARERYGEMRRGRGRVFEGHFFAKDAYGEWLGEIPLIREVGIDESVNLRGAASSRWAKGGFDVVTMMFCMHYAFESEAKARGMLRNVAASLKKGGRFIGVIPNSDVLREEVVKWHQKQVEGKATGTGSSDDKEKTKDLKEKLERQEPATEPVCEWGNSIYHVRFPGKTPSDGVFRPPFGWKYSFLMEEAVEDVPEYVVPWEAFRALAEDFNLELQYRKPFSEVWKEENHDPDLGQLADRMNVRDRNTGELAVSKEEMEAVSFYLGFCFYKV